MIIAGTAVGAGMFSLPVVMSGVWFNISMVALLLTWFCMTTSGLMILEANLNYPEGASFHTIVLDLLGPVWNVINGLTVAFVLYILTYAYISGGNSIVSMTLNNTLGYVPPSAIGSLSFALILAFIVWLSTKAVDRITTIMIGGMVITFFLSIGGLMGEVKHDILFNTIEPNASYWPYFLVTLPFCLASFGFHGNVPSLMKYYGKAPKKIIFCIVTGTVIALTIYVFWQLSALGNISRTDFKAIIAQGGNMGVLVGALNRVINNPSLSYLLSIFSALAVATSFLGVTLGLFDYIADMFKIGDSRSGRTLTALITFIPPTLGGVLYPEGFITAIGFAGLAAAVWAAIVPALMARASRQRFGSPLFRVWGGSVLIWFIVLYGLTNAVAHVLAMMNVLPVYR